jgi:carboxymethylenebutenolidase
MRPLLSFAILLLPAGCAGRLQEPPAQPGGTESISFRSGKEKGKAILYRPAGKGPFPAVVVVHGDFGLTPWVKEQAARLAEQGYVALAVDLYRGETPAELMDAHIMSRGVPDERALADLRAAVDYLTDRPDVQAEQIGILGWEMGGGYALDAARVDHRLNAVVICYGRLMTDPELLKPLHAPVLGIFAGHDEGISRETIDQFQAALHKAGKPDAEVHIYPTCGHGFMDASDSSGSGAAATEATADAWKKIEAFLATQLKS